MMDGREARLRRACAEFNDGQRPAIDRLFAGLGDNGPELALTPLAFLLAFLLASSSFSA